MDFEKSLQSAVTDYLESDKLKNYIISQTEKTINDIIDSSLRYGELNKSLNEIIKDQLIIDNERIGSLGLSNIITEIVKESLNKHIHESATKKIADSISDLTSPLPKILTVQMFIDKVLEHVDTSEITCHDVNYETLLDMGYDINELFTFNVSKPDNDKYRWVDIDLDIKPGRSRYECEFQLTINSGNRMTIKHRGVDLRKQDVIYGYNHSLEIFLLKMFVNECTLDYNELLEFCD
ncbi:MAG: hypothetical protein WC136_03745 [Sphaerochaeta sp.]|jgi:hypothetical protein